MAVVYVRWGWAGPEDTSKLLKEMAPLPMDSCYIDISLPAHVYGLMQSSLQSIEWGEKNPSGLLSVVLHNI